MYKQLLNKLALKRERKTRAEVFCTAFLNSSNILKSLDYAILTFVNTLPNNNKRVVLYAEIWKLNSPKQTKPQKH